MPLNRVTLSIDVSAGEKHNLIMRLVQALADVLAQDDWDTPASSVRISTEPVKE